MNKIIRFACVLIVGTLTACHSPEANRTRGGGAGADIGNRNAAVEMHEGAQPYHDTPCRTTDVKCTGARPSFEDGRRKQ
jgi:hypothetical protein